MPSNCSPLLLSIPKGDPGQKSSYLAAAAGPAVIVLLFRVFTGTILFSATWAVIQVGRTLFLSPEFKAAISLVADEKESGPTFTDFLFYSGQRIPLITSGTVGLFVQTESQALIPTKKNKIQGILIS